MLLLMKYTKKEDFMSLVNVIVWILIGILVGWVASKIWKQKSMSLIGYFLVGIIGSFIGGFLFDLLGISLGGGIGSFVTSVIGAIILLFILSKIKK